MKENGLTQLCIRRMDTDESHYLDFGEPAYIAYTSTNPEMNTNILRFGYTSMTTPSSTFDYNMETKEKTLKSNRKY